MIKTKSSLFRLSAYLLVLATLFSLVAIFSSNEVRAIECDGVLTSEDCLHTTSGVPITGNYRIATGAIGQYPQEATESFVLDVPACADSSPSNIIQATAYWALREYNDDPTYWDESVDIARNAGTPITINSDRRYKAQPDPGATSSYIADVLADGLIANGTHTYTITNLTNSVGATNPNSSQWGFGLQAIYECPEFPSVTIVQKDGHDMHWRGWGSAWASDRSELICESYPVAAVARNATVDFFLAGSVNTTQREADIWYLTGTGSVPTPAAFDLLSDVNTPNMGGQVLERLVFVGEPELEVYNSPTINLPAGTNYLCIQTDSSFDYTEHPDDTGVAGASMFAGAGWFTFDVVPAANDLSLGNFVWEDLDNDGVLNGSEIGICDVDVHLYMDVDSDNKYTSADGTTPIDTTTTSCGLTPGEYNFTGLAPGDYIVVIPQAELDSGDLMGMMSSSGTTGSVSGPFEPAPDPDTAPETNNDDNGYHIPGVGVVTCAVTLTDGGEPTTDGDSDNDSNLSVDFGFYAAPAPAGDLVLGNMVWDDVNNNGIIDGSETGICNVDVHLYMDTNSDNKYDPSVEGTTPLAMATTACGASAGEYLFTGLAAGDYIVVIPQAELDSGDLQGYVSSTGANGLATGSYEAAPDPDDSSDPNNDDNGYHLDGVGVVTCAVTLVDNAEPVTDGDSDTDSNLSVDFGFFNDAKLGDFVWYDTNNNGLQDSGETGVENVTATLHNASDDSVVATMVTDSQGAYQFCYLIPGDYYVVFSNLPSDYSLTSTEAGDDAQDSDADPTTARTGTYILVAGSVESTVDGGIQNTTVLADTGTGPMTIAAAGTLLAGLGAVTLKRTNPRFSLKK